MFLASKTGLRASSSKLNVKPPRRSGKPLTCPQADGVDFLVRAEIQLPPGIGIVLDGVRHALAVVAVLVAIDGAAGIATVAGGGLRGLAALRDVFSTAQDFDLRDLQALLVPRDFDADVACGFGLRDSGDGE